MTDLPIFAAPRRVAPVSGLPLHRERLHEAAEAMPTCVRAAEIIKLVRSQPAQIRNLITANLGAYDGR